MANQSESAARDKAATSDGRGERFMDREMLGQVLGELIPGDSTEMDEATLGIPVPAR